MVRPKSPTALLWAFELRREHTALLARLGALERKEEERRTTRDAEEVVETIRAEEVGNELRGLGSTVEGLEVRVDGLVGRVDEVEVEGRRRNESGLELGKRVERLAARFEEIAAVGVRPEAEAEVELRNASPRPSQANIEGQVESQREESEEDLLFAEIEALQQGSRELVEYLESTERVLVQAPAGWERYVAEIFVAGIADEELRAQVESDLNREGWAWQRVRETVSRTADRGKRKRKRRYIVRPEDMAEYMKVTP